MAVRDNLGVISAALGAMAAVTGLAYVVLRRRAEVEVRTLGEGRARRYPVVSGALAERVPGFGPYIEKARTELSTKDLRRIQIETALTWTGRACAAADARKMAEANEYAHEGIEHAALSGVPGLLDKVREVLLEHGVDL